MAEEKVLLHAVLVYPIRDGKVLLGRKTRGIGAGKLCGFGGGIEEDDRGDPIKAAVRELEEECRIKAHPSQLKKVAVIDFNNTKRDGGQFTCRVHVFLIQEWRGEPQATKEMVSLNWFPLDRLPFDEMMLSDRDWLPLIFRGPNGTKVVATVNYGPFQQTIISPTIVMEVKELPA